MEKKKYIVKIDTDSKECGKSVGYWIEDKKGHGISLQRNGATIFHRQPNRKKILPKILDMFAPDVKIELTIEKV